MFTAVGAVVMEPKGMVAVCASVVVPVFRTVTGPYFCVPERIGPEKVVLLTIVPYIQVESINRYVVCWDSLMLWKPQIQDCLYHVNVYTAIKKAPEGAFF
jgi:hypothetical protein